MTLKTVRVADYIMQALAEAQVRHVFLLPGGGAMHLNDALIQSGIGYVPCHHEQACGIAAEAYGRITENLGVAMVTCGPGATNIITAVAGAWIESTPLLIISGQVKRADLLRGAPLRQSGVQEVDIVSMVQPITKYAVTVEDPAMIRVHLEKALYLARHGRQGPVWLDVPLDVQAARVEVAALAGFTPPVLPGTLVEDADMERAVQLIAAAERPLLLAGHGVRLSGAAASFRQLAEALAVPVVTTWNAMDLLPDDHPLNVGRPGTVALRAPNFAVQNCDLLISIGCRLDNVVTAYNPANFARKARKIVVDVDPHELAKLGMPVDLGMAADAQAFIAGLLGRVRQARPKDRSGWRARCQEWKRRYPAPTGDEAPAPGLSHYRLVAALSEALPADGLIATGSSGLAVEVFYSVFRNKPGQRIFLTSGLGAMGYGLPAAIGACLANDSRPMVLIEGDGSLQLNIQELATLKALQLPICVIVMNNNGYASIRNTQRNYFQGRYIATGPEAGLYFPDLVRLAEAVGLGAHRIDASSDLDARLRQVLAAPRPCICDVRLRENEVLMPKVSAVPQADGSMISMPLEDMSPLLSLEELRQNVGEVAPESIKVRQ